MKEALTYFKAERAESLLFIAAGGASVLLALWFWFSVKKPFYNGLATSLAALALIQLVVGFTVYFRTPLDIKKVETFLMNDPSKIKSEDEPHVHALVAFKFEVMIAVRVAGEIRTVDLRHHGERGEPFCALVADHRAEIERGVLPFLVFGNLVVIAEFQPERPPGVQLTRYAEGRLELAFLLAKIIPPLRRVREVQCPSH